MRTSRMLLVAFFVFACFFVVGGGIYSCVQGSSSPVIGGGLIALLLGLGFLIGGARVADPIAKKWLFRLGLLGVGLFFVPKLWNVMQSLWQLIFSGKVEDKEVFATFDFVAVLMVLSFIWAIMKGGIFRWGVSIFLLLLTLVSAGLEGPLFEKIGKVWESVRPDVAKPLGSWYGAAVENMDRSIEISKIADQEYHIKKDAPKYSVDPVTNVASNAGKFSQDTNVLVLEKVEVTNNKGLNLFKVMEEEAGGRFVSGAITYVYPPDLIKGRKSEPQKVQQVPIPPIQQQTKPSAVAEKPKTSPQQQVKVAKQPPPAIPPTSKRNDDGGRRETSFRITSPVVFLSSLENGYLYEVFNRTSEDIRVEVWRKGVKKFTMVLQPNGRLFNIITGDELRLNPAPPPEGYRFALVKGATY